MSQDGRWWLACVLVLGSNWALGACGGASASESPGDGGSDSGGGGSSSGGAASGGRGSGGDGTGGVILTAGGTGGDTGGAEPTDPCLLTACDRGQRCEADGEVAVCVDNECSDLSCSEAERCEPHELGGHICVSIGCSTDVDCAADEYCDGTICQPDACEPDRRICEAATIVECSSNGAELAELYTCGSAAYFTSECVDVGNGHAACSCEDDWDCPAHTSCEVDSCQGTGTIPSCTLPPTPFTETLPAEEIHWGGDSVTDDAAHDGTPERNPAAWATQSNVHNTPIVANLDDDNHDGLINERDFPEIIFTAWNTAGVLRAIHGGGPRKGADYFARCGDAVWHEGDELPADEECVDVPGAPDPATPVAVGDLNYDGVPEIVFKTRFEDPADDPIRIVDNTGEFLLDLPPASDPSSMPTVALANLDYSGFAEIIVGRDVYLLGDDGSGGFQLTHHLTGTGSPGDNHISQMVCPADLTDDPGQEIVAGGTLYRLPDPLPTCTEPPCTGELSIVWDANDTLPEGSAASGNGFCAVADVWVRGEGSDRGAAPSPGNEPDGIPEIILIDNGILVVLGSDGVLLYEENLEGGDLGGAPNVDDFDGDGYMEIASALAEFYVVVDLQAATDDGGNCPAWPEVLPRDPAGGNPNPERTPGRTCASNGDCNDGAVCNELRSECVCLHNGWRRESDDDSSRATSSSVFDFNGDGAAEVLYNDECDFRVYDGLTGNVLAAEINRSTTLIENPVVADVDNDGNAEVMTVANTAASGRCDEDESDPRGPNGLRVWGDPADTWVSARRIWNQHSYYITNVTEGGTIPLHPPQSWVRFDDRTFNTFRSQPRSYGVAPNLTVTDVGVFSPDAACGELTESIELTFLIENQGDLRVGPGVTVGFIGIWGDEEEALLSAPGGEHLELTLTQSLEPGRSVRLSVSYSAANNERETLPDRVRVIVDVHDIERECDEDDNELEQDVDAGAVRPDLELLLGTATADCPDGLVTVTLRNVGTESVSDVGLAFFAGDPSQGGGLLHGETFPGPLAPGEEQTFEVTIAHFPTTGDVTIYGVADPANGVDECNEANNQDAAGNAISCRIEVPH